MLPASEHREVLRIRTDLPIEHSPPGCFSASYVSFTAQSSSPVKAMSAPPTGGLKQLRLVSDFLSPLLPPLILPSPPSLIRGLLYYLPIRRALHPAFCPVSTLVHQSASNIDNHPTVDHIFNSSTPQSPSVSSTTSFSCNSLVCQLVSRRR